MGTQHTFADAVYATKRCTTRRAQFLTELDQVIPWTKPEGIVVPHYPTAGRGWRPLPLGTMLRIYPPAVAQSLVPAARGHAV